MSNSQSMDDRILLLEEFFGCGTQIKRVLAEKSGYEWSLGVGRLNMPKLFFTGPSIEAVVCEAETYKELQLSE